MALGRVVGNAGAVGADKTAAQLFLPRDRARVWVRQLLVQRIGFLAARGIAQHRLQGLMFAAPAGPAAAQRATAARAGGPDAHVFSLHAVLANRAAARHCGEWAMALAHA